MKDNEVEDFILEGDQVCEYIAMALYPITVFILHMQLNYMEDFFAANGSKCLLFYYEETITMENGEHIYIVVTSKSAGL